MIVLVSVSGAASEAHYCNERSIEDARHGQSHFQRARLPARIAKARSNTFVLAKDVAVVSGLP